MKQILEEKLAIAITGMPGSGKSYIAKLISDRLNAPIFSMGDIVREEVLSRGLPLTLENVEKIATQLRKEKGNNAVALLLLERLNSYNKNIVLIDGVRGIEELKILREKFKICLIAVHASPIKRLIRLKERNRESKEITWNDLFFRDMKNLEYGIGNVIALSDYMIINEEEGNSSLNIEKIIGAIKDGSWKNYCRGGIETY